MKRFCGPVYVLVDLSYISQQQAMDDPYRERWLEAMHDELASLIENEVFELCELPLGAVALTGKWVLKMKREPQG